MIDIQPIASTLPALLDAAGRYAPYLQRLIQRDAADLGLESIDTLVESFAPWMAESRSTLSEITSVEPGMAALRQFKRQGHLLIALQDLSGVAAQAEITRRLSQMADLALETALRLALAKRGLDGRGLCLVSLGKHGARELNYSSDIDMVALYEPARFDGGERDCGDAACRVIRDLVSILETQTGDGYVFRTDFRLRPDPSSTPVAVSASMAEAYYESVGQNWERMVYIKARPSAGDLAVGDGFLKRLEPFVWRRHLDYWALDDIYAIKRMINAKVGDPDLGDVASDLKLGPGGIREIEFFAQTQQVILGGRDIQLRDPTTQGALVRLAEAGAIEWSVSRELSSAYDALRSVEHRVQMLNDQQTHTLPSSEVGRDKVAALCGYASRAEFEAGLLACRETVHRHYGDLFADDHRRARDRVSGNLVFTGVDADPATVQTLRKMGFSDPASLISAVQSWHRGRVPATRTPLGRELLTAILPDLLLAMADSGEADTAFRQFAIFFEGLSAGVQFLSLLLANSALLDDLISTLALAPRLARTLSRHPECIDAMIDGGEQDALILPSDLDFESAMGEARRYHREETLLIGHQLLHGALPADAAGEAWTQLADETLIAMANAAERETARRFGPPPGAWHVFALGKLGGRELTAGSDLDLLVLFDPHPGASDAQTWFTRFTQRLITALSAPTGEGELYEIDMRLRPSGGAGPVAVSLPAFCRYQEESAWTWEHMALTRLRPVAGDPALARKAMTAATGAIMARAGAANIRQDIADMRARIAREKPPRGMWDVKLAEGGLVDIEFITQLHLLCAGDSRLVTGNTKEALDRLTTARHIDPETATALQEALRFQQSLQQFIRLAVGDVTPGMVFPAGLQSRLCRAVEADDFDGLKRRLGALRSDVAGIFAEKLPLAATE